MERAATIFLAAIVLLGGILLAMPYRRPPAPAGTPAPIAAGEPSVREAHRLAAVGVPFVEHLADRVEVPPASPPESPIELPNQPAWARPEAPPPELPRSYPRYGREAASAPPAPPDRAAWAETFYRPPRTHKIVDGDSLAALAERYLGDGGRYLELFELNRDVLPHPDLLPIGVELKLPSPGRDEALGEDLVPVARGR